MCDLVTLAGRLPTLRPFWKAACQRLRPRMFSDAPPRSNRPTNDHAKLIDKPIDMQQTAAPIGIDGAVGLSAITGSEAVWTTAEALRTRHHR